MLLYTLTLWQLYAEINALVSCYSEKIRYSFVCVVKCSIFVGERYVISIFFFRIFHCADVFFNRKFSWFFLSRVFCEMSPLPLKFKIVKLCFSSWNLLFDETCWWFLKLNESTLSSTRKSSTQFKQNQLVKYLISNKSIK